MILCFAFKHNFYRILKKSFLFEKSVFQIFSFDKLFLITILVLLLDNQFVSNNIFSKFPKYHFHPIFFALRFNQLKVNENIFLFSIQKTYESRFHHFCYFANSTNLENLYIIKHG
ncbi:hypothetical protein EDEG_02314 [Edhazardia aedis USNM 41457]|uniref:Uncharacterized protein n=1 Tax=Edhazardia aedis (strain USNM 41457) TaxID=1003232 RepID=J9DPR9_EDHAE|nr:hypothetical protein EDEG_02314 [Edhazardia aedis USNM 41457]|eukprot:EJW03357.1 hypothetical protein EDEG_02314 [Edhazardia aedis USNM 41457]